MEQQKTFNERFEDKFIKIPSNETKSGFKLDCDPEFAKGFFHQEIEELEREIEKMQTYQHNLLVEKNEVLELINKRFK